MVYRKNRSAIYRLRGAVGAIFAWLAALFFVLSAIVGPDPALEQIKAFNQALEEAQDSSFREVEDEQEDG